jgi:hypothetical protein
MWDDFFPDPGSRAKESTGCRIPILVSATLSQSKGLGSRNSFMAVIEFSSKFSHVLHVFKGIFTVFILL